jgi:hypothetical protein
VGSGMVFSSMQSQSVGVLLMFWAVFLGYFLIIFLWGILSLALRGATVWEGMIQIINDC